MGYRSVLLGRRTDELTIQIPANSEWKDHCVCLRSGTMNSDYDTSKPGVL